MNMKRLLHKKKKKIGIKNEAWREQLKLSFLPLVQTVRHRKLYVHISEFLGFEVDAILAKILKNTVERVRHTININKSGYGTIPRQTFWF